MTSGTQGSYLYRPVYGAQGQAEFDAFNTGLVSADSVLHSAASHITTAGYHTNVYTTTVTATNVYGTTLTATSITATNISASTINKVTTLIATNISADTTSGGRADIRTINATTVTATNVYATVMTANDLSATTSQGNSTTLYTRTVGACATAGTTVATGTYVTVPACSVVFIRALVTCYATLGTAAGSAGAYEVRASAMSGGKTVNVTTIPQTAVAFSQSEYTSTIAAGVGMVALTFTGSAETMQWAYEIETMRVLAAG